MCLHEWQLKYQRRNTSFAEIFPDAAFALLVQIKPYDAFGKQMMINLEVCIKCWVYLFG